MKMGSLIGWYGNGSPHAVEYKGIREGIGKTMDCRPTGTMHGNDDFWIEVLHFKDGLFNDFFKIGAGEMKSAH
jgi:hypothetical protein